MLIDPLSLDLVPPLLLSSLLIFDPLSILNLRQGKQELLVVFQCRERVFVFVDVALHVVDFVFEIF